MRIMSLSALLIFSCIAFTDSATQTDWSGGPGSWGPVLDWGDDFYWNQDIDWFSEAGCLLLCLAEYLVEDAYPVDDIQSVDIDGDGFMDIVGSSWWYDAIHWWKNVDGTGQLWVKKLVDGSFDDVQAVCSADVDGDGHCDVLGAAWGAQEVAWWRYNESTGNFGARQIIDDESLGYDVSAGDIDGDGDTDAIGESEADLCWWENADGAGNLWVEHVIDGPALYGYSVGADDINCDGNMDVIATWVIPGKVAWWENIDGLGSVWTKHTIPESLTTVCTISSADINGDGYTDVIAVSDAQNLVEWFENTDGTGQTWIPHIIVDGGFDPISVEEADIDDDGDMDVLSAGFYTDNIAWWENTDGTGLNWAMHTVIDGFQYAHDACAEDINGDGNPDIIGCRQSAGDLAWWDLNGYCTTGCLESSLLDTGCDPDWDWIDWNADSPPGTAVILQVRSTDTPNTPPGWSIDLTEPCSLEGILVDGDTFVQYRVILETSDPFSTPVLNDVTIQWNITGIADTAEPIPCGFALLPVCPNPSSAPAVRFSLPEPAAVELSVFDLSGRSVREIHGDGYTQGYHDVLLGELPPGIYFCRMISGDFTATQRFVVIE